MLPRVIFRKRKLSEKNDDLFNGQTERDGSEVSKLCDRRVVDRAGRRIQMAQVAFIQYNVIRPTFSIIFVKRTV